MTKTQLQDVPLQFIETNGLRLAYRRLGQGPALILLHGFPQNHRCWEKVVPEFAKHFDVLIPDLRGYGASDAPFDDSPDHATYSKRTMAQDIIGLMDRLGLEQAHILGHDRGARVAYRFALDHPARIAKLGIIEIVPTGDFWNNWSAELAMKAYHWTYLAQPYPLPERMINADPKGYINWTFEKWIKQGDVSPFSDWAMDSYLTQAENPARIHAMCADYRSGWSFDRALDVADKNAGRKIDCPLMFLWGRSGFPAQTGDPASLWADWAHEVNDMSCDSGHFVMEENPKAVTECFISYFLGD
ncbi:alpha/beta fold hydrolase [Algirhabdus cladophorae]|uniref:alpha/beta fold hydrolase n=1 Tax=Algirhabdus cladophorae TaxID=3377108 RepID=UPI003B84596E